MEYDKLSKRFYFFFPKNVDIEGFFMEINDNNDKWYATHYIDMNLLKSTNISKKEREFLLDLKKQTKNLESILGIPLNFDKLLLEKKFSINSIKDYEWLFKNSFLSMEINPYEKYYKNSLEKDKGRSMLNTGLGVNVFDVGNGLTVYDYSNNILFDCGGNSTKLPSLVRELTRLKPLPFDIVISHFHTDHFSYLPNLLEVFNKSIKNVYFSESILNISFFEDLAKKFTGVKFSTIRDKQEVNGYIAHYRNKRDYKDPNLNGACLVNDENLLTGDMSYLGINEILRKQVNKEFDFFQIPHHGSQSTATGELKSLDKDISIKIAIYSYKKARPSLESHAGGKIKSICKS